MPKYQIWKPKYRETLHAFSAVEKAVIKGRPSGSRTTEPLGDPRLKELVEVMKKTMEEKKRILLYGDYDVDGSMSCVLWIWFFNYIGFTKYDYYIPSRQGKGYGVHTEVLQEFHLKNPLSMVITMDTGITARKEAQWCQDHGIIPVITDHHSIIESELPQCGYVLNPKLQKEAHSYHNLCGCGVTLLLISSLAHELSVDLSPWTGDGLAITALATVCDMVPLVGDNRELVRKGLQSFQSSSRPVLKALREHATSRCSDPHPQLSSEDFAFRIGPLLNAVGRLGEASQIVEIFTQDQDPQLLAQNIISLQSYSERRRELDQKILAEASDVAESMLEQDPDLPILFVGGKDWHPGVLGLVAGRMVERFGRPTWIYTQDQEDPTLMKGSVRSFSENSLRQTLCVITAMTRARELFVRFGGHKVAAGFTFKAARKKAIQERLVSYGRELKEQKPELWQGEIFYEAALHPSLLTLELHHTLSKLEPYGVSFEKPVFLIEGLLQKLQLYQDRRSGESKHSAVFLDLGPKVFRVMFFGLVLEELAERSGEKVQCLVEVRSSWFRGEPKLDLLGVDYRLHSHPDPPTAESSTSLPWGPSYGL